MRVEQIVTPEGAIRYLLLDEQGEIVLPVLRYLKFLDTGYTARNSLRTYCYQLRLFFTFLQERGLSYTAVGIDEIATFVRWLQYPVRWRLEPREQCEHDTCNEDELPSQEIRRAQAARQPRTVNAILTGVLRFYDYLMIHEDYRLQLSARLRRQLEGSRRPFKDFLYHLSHERPFLAKRLRVRVPKERPKTISKAAVAALVGACHNQRDAFLVRLLWESGMRIGEVLALWLEDIEIDARRIHIRDRGQLVNEAEIKTESSLRVLDVSADLIDADLAYVGEVHTLEVATNHVFVKLAGPARWEPLAYTDVAALFRRLRRTTGISVTPHMLRHTSLTTLRKAGWTDEQLRRRAGHAHAQTTVQMYVHPDEREMHAAWERVEARMRLPK